MIRIFLLSLGVLMFNLAYGQLAGDVVASGRKLITNVTYVIEGNQNGKVVFDVSVNALGALSGIKVNQQESTINSTPTHIKARNHISDWKFEPGTHFPQYHQGRITITVVKPNN